MMTGEEGSFWRRARLHLDFHESGACCLWVGSPKPKAQGWGWVQGVHEPGEELVMLEAQTHQ